MEPLVLVALSGAVFAAVSISSTVRGILRSIFRRPRETSVLLKVDGKQTELSSSRLEAQRIAAQWAELSPETFAAIKAVLREQNLSDEQAEAVAQAVIQHLYPAGEPTRVTGTHAVAEGEADE